MEIRQVLKSSGSMIPVLFYKMSAREKQNQAEKRETEKEGQG